MKILLVLITAISLTGMTARAQENLEKIRPVVLDSLNKHTVPYTQLKEKYKSARAQGNKAFYPEETITLDNGVSVTFQTTDNARTRAMVSQLFKISPVDFLIGIRGIEGRISITTALSGWVKKEDLPQLLKLATVDVPSPHIKQKMPGAGQTKGVAKKYDSVYLKTPLGINALDLIGSYLSGIFPSVTPSYESVKNWYDSGKPKEEYKFEPFTPVVKDPVLPHSELPKTFHRS